MKITILSLFPDSFSGFLSGSMIGRAQKKGLAQIENVNLRDFATDSYGSIDDKPYGGGAGMVLRVDILVAALKKYQTPVSKTILLTPQGHPLTQAKVRELAQSEHLVLIAGHYEGFDERIRDYVDLEISIGDYVLTGGELPAAVVTDAVVRLLPGVLGNDDSPIYESFSDGLLEHPHYTRPAEFEGKKVPEILISGNHAEIAKWRTEQSKLRTASRRPDLIK